MYGSIEYFLLKIKIFYEKIKKIVPTQENYRFRKDRELQRPTFSDSQGHLDPQGRMF